MPLILPRLKVVVISNHSKLVIGQEMNVLHALCCRLTSKLRALGLAGVVAYGLLNTLWVEFCS